MYLDIKSLYPHLKVNWNVLCWFQTNLPLAALPLRRLASLAVSELQLSAATPLWLFTERQSLQSWIEFNCLRSAAVSKAARLSIYWLDAACRLVIPLRQVALAQLYKNHHQSGNAASGKLVWNQHYCVKFVLRGAWLSTFSRDAMRIICLSLAGRWWRAEWETGLLIRSVSPVLRDTAIR